MVLRRDLDRLESDGLLHKAGKKWAATEAGLMHLRRCLAQVDEFQSQHRLDGAIVVNENGAISRKSANMAESPLMRLHYRKDRAGNHYLDETCFQAGERLRADFTRGQLTPSVTSNWSTFTSGQSGSSASGISDLSDAALAARIRLENALATVGPEFSGVLLDICCFLKGLEQVERERQWPPRSAKLMLKTGLSILARYYGTDYKSENHDRLRQQHKSDCRPAPVAHQ